MKLKIAAPLALAALLAGIATGCATDAATADPEAFTPQACLDALDEAEYLASLSADVTNINADVMGNTMVDAITAAYEWDADGLDQATREISTATSEIEAITEKVEASNYTDLAAACRASS